MSQNRTSGRWYLPLIVLMVAACLPGCVNNHVAGDQTNVFDPAALTDPIVEVADKLLLP